MAQLLNSMDSNPVIMCLEQPLQALEGNASHMSMPSWANAAPSPHAGHHACNPMQPMHLESPTCMAGPPATAVRHSRCSTDAPSCQPAANQAADTCQVAMLPSHSSWPLLAELAPPICHTRLELCRSDAAQQPELPTTQGMHVQSMQSDGAEDMLFRQAGTGLQDDLPASLSPNPTCQHNPQQIRGEPAWPQRPPLSPATTGTLSSKHQTHSGCALKRLSMSILLLLTITPDTIVGAARTGTDLLTQWTGPPEYSPDEMSTEVEPPSPPGPRASLAGPRNAGVDLTSPSPPGPRASLSGPQNVGVDLAIPSPVPQPGPPMSPGSADPNLRPVKSVFTASGTECPDVLANGNFSDVCTWNYNTAIDSCLLFAWCLNCTIPPATIFSYLNLQNCIGGRVDVDCSGQIFCAYGYNPPNPPPLPPIPPPLPPIPSPPNPPLQPPAPPPRPPRPPPSPLPPRPPINVPPSPPPSPPSPPPFPPSPPSPPDPPRPPLPPAPPAPPPAPPSPPSPPSPPPAPPPSPPSPPSPPPSLPSPPSPPPSPSPPSPPSPPPSPPSPPSPPLPVLVPPSPYNIWYIPPGYSLFATYQVPRAVTPTDLTNMATLLANILQLPNNQVVTSLAASYLTVVYTLVGPSAVQCGGGILEAQLQTAVCGILAVSATCQDYVAVECVTGLAQIKFVPKTAVLHTLQPNMIQLAVRILLTNSGLDNIGTVTKITGQNVTLTNNVTVILPQATQVQLISGVGWRVINPPVLANGNVPPSIQVTDPQLATATAQPLYIPTTQAIQTYAQVKQDTPPPAPPGGSCKKPHLGSLCGGDAVAAIVGIAVGGALVLGLIIAGIAYAMSHRTTRVIIMDEDFTWADRYRHIMPTNLTRSPYTTQYQNPSYAAGNTHPALFAAGETALPPGYSAT